MAVWFVRKNTVIGLWLVALSNRKNYIFPKKDFVFNEVLEGFHEKYT